jgi:cytochrome d ubiquinol oxidase subunit I
VQPVKFAAMEALYEGKSDAGLIAMGILKDSDKKIGEKEIKDFAFKIEIPGLLSVLTGGDREAYVQGINDHISGNEKIGIISVNEKIQRGLYAKDVLVDFKNAKAANDTQKIDSIKNIFKNKEFQENYFRYFGYAALDKPEDAIPSVAISFYSFHLMVILGFTFILIFAAALYFLFKGTITDNKWFLWIALLAVPLTYISSELGWVLAEMGRQPWIIQDLMAVSSGVSKITSGTVMTTFILFAVLFTGLLIAEISIMLKQIKTGPKH